LALLLPALLLLPLLLQDVEKMRHAVGLKAYSSQQPLDEFRLEANRAFLLLLDTYRDAVVARLMVPDLNFSLLLGQQQEELLASDVLADMQQQQQQSGGNGRHEGSLQSTSQSSGTSGVSGHASGNGSGSGSDSSSPADGLQPAATSAGRPSSS
jgi:preprotein translocase subunit SecA